MVLIGCGSCDSRSRWRDERKKREKVGVGLRVEDGSRVEWQEMAAPAAYHLPPSPSFLVT